MESDVNTKRRIYYCLGKSGWYCDEIRLSVEFVTVGFLGICRHSCCD